jgi:hypothetical protein
MRTPTNAIAEAIVKMQQENGSSQVSIDYFTASIAKNNSAIAAMEEFATWDEVPDSEDSGSDSVTPPDEQ